MKEGKKRNYIVFDIKNNFESSLCVENNFNVKELKKIFLHWNKIFVKVKKTKNIIIPKTNTFVVNFYNLNNIQLFIKNLNEKKKEIALKVPNSLKIIHFFYKNSFITYKVFVQMLYIKGQKTFTIMVWYIHTLLVMCVTIMLNFLIKLKSFLRNVLIPVSVKKNV